ncbi:MAG: transposase [Gammaproteobacteria bacterium]
MVRLAESIGGNQAAKRLGIPDSSMRNWVRLSRAGKLKVAKGTRGQVKPGVRDLESENERLRLALANVKLDLEIVKMAARSSRRNRGEVRLKRVVSRSVSSHSFVSLSWRITLRVLSVASQTDQRSRDRECGFGCQGGERSCAK